MTHRDKKPYQCTVPGCNKSYCDARSLRRHLENHHQHTTEQIASEMVKAQSTAAEVLAEVAQLPPQQSSASNQKSSSDSNNSAIPETLTGANKSSNTPPSNVYSKSHYVSVSAGNGSTVTGSAVTSPQQQHSQLFQYELMVQQQKQQQQQNEQQQQQLKQQQQEIQQRDQRQKQQDQQELKVMKPSLW